MDTQNRRIAPEVAWKYRRTILNAFDEATLKFSVPLVLPEEKERITAIWESLISRNRNPLAQAMLEILSRDIPELPPDDYPSLVQAVLQLRSNKNMIM